MDVYSIATDLLQFKEIRFLIAGGLATAVDYAVFIPLVLWVNVRYKVAATISFIPAVLLGFALQKIWVFQNPAASFPHVQLLVFILKQLLFLGAIQVILHAGVEWGKRGPVAVKVVATVLLAVLSYIVNDRLIFTH